MKQEEKIPTIRQKLSAVAQNTYGAMEYLKTYSHYIIDSEKWREELQPLKDQLETFLQNRGTSTADFAGLINHGSMFVTTHPHFFRAEHIKENLKLSPAEKLELHKELHDAFSDKDMKEELLRYAAVIGWCLQDILMPYADLEACEKTLQDHLTKIRQSIINKHLADQLLHTLTSVKKGIVLADGLEKAGIEVLADDSIKPKSDKAAAMWKEMMEIQRGERPKNDRASLFTDTDIDEVPDFKDLETPIAKLVLQLTSMERF